MNGKFISDFLRRHPICRENVLTVKKVQLKTNFSLRSRISGETELPPSVNTIGELLRHIGKEIDFVFIDAEGVTLRRDVEVLINSKDISFLPSGLKTILKEGDSVDIALMTLGGG